MKPRSTLRGPAACALLWATALLCTYLPLPHAVVALPAFLAVLVVPGALLDLAVSAGSPRTRHRAELPARAFVLSLGLVSLIGPATTALGGSIHALLGVLFVLTLGLAAAPRARHEADADNDDELRSVPLVAAWTALAALALLAVAMSLGADNVARDRTWYLAYITRVSDGTTLSWSDPVLGTGRVLARFAHNGWITALAAWRALAQCDAAAVFAGAAPPLLTGLLASASLCAARALLGSGAPAVLGAFATLLVYLATRYPFFSPDRYALFGRLAEDKFVALAVLLPVALSFVFDAARSQGRGTARAVVLAAVALAATAFSHAIVYLLLVIAAVPPLVFAIARRGDADRAPALVAAAVVVAIAIVPAWLGLGAREQIVDAPMSTELLREDPTHPVVRSHVRMERLLDIGPAGPIVDPRLIAEPLLLLCLCGVLACLGRGRSRGTGYLLWTTAAFSALAFAPALSPAFGRLVVPWMSYRALWGIHFGLLATVLVVAVAERLRPPGDGRSGVAVLLGIALFAVAAPTMPWTRVLALGESRTSRLAPDADLLALLDRIAELPADSRVAAAPSLAELVPAYAGRPVLAVSDRATVVFSGTRAEAERRLQANAVVTGLSGGSRRLRARMIGAHRVTHTAYEGRDCDRDSVAIYQDDRFALCAERPRQPSAARMERFTAVAAPTPRGSVVARIGAGLTCTPAPLQDDDRARYRWRRESRWSGRPVAVSCRARFDEPVGPLRLRLALRLPHAREAVVFRIASRGAGRRLGQNGVVEIRDNPFAELRVPGHRVDRVRIRLVPAYLPYLNLDELELRTVR